MNSSLVMGSTFRLSNGVRPLADFCETFARDVHGTLSFVHCISTIYKQGHYNPGQCKFPCAVFCVERATSRAFPWGFCPPLVFPWVAFVLLFFAFCFPLGAFVSPWCKTSRAARHMLINAIGVARGPSPSISCPR